jgi:hypothetical protein
MAHFIQNSHPVNLVEVRSGGQVEVALWGDGPNHEVLHVETSDSSVARVEEIEMSFADGLRRFRLQGLRQGSARLWARVGRLGQIWADARVMVGYLAFNRYYHGTNQTIANLLLGTDLTPMTIPPPTIMSSDWTDYTDFGKGFYVHLEPNKAMAYEWAKRRFKTDWAVVEFIATPDELSAIASTALLYQNKTDRPWNSPRPVVITTRTTTVEVCPLPQFLPQVLPCLEVSSRQTTVTAASSTMSWLEFVEHNRHIVRGGALIARPNDRDWTASYSSMRGPIWVPRDSGYDTGLPKFPDSLHQLNWGLGGMTMLNQATAKVRRFKFSSDNEGLFPPPA